MWLWLPEWDGAEQNPPATYNPAIKRVLCCTTSTPTVAAFWSLNSPSFQTHILLPVAFFFLNINFTVFLCLICYLDPVSSDSVPSSLPCSQYSGPLLHSVDHPSSTQSATPASNKIKIHPEHLSVFSVLPTIPILSDLWSRMRHSKHEGKIADWIFWASCLSKKLSKGRLFIKQSLMWNGKNVYLPDRFVKQVFRVSPSPCVYVSQFFF